MAKQERWLVEQPRVHGVVIVDMVEVEQTKASAQSALT